MHELTVIISGDEDVRESVAVDVSEGRTADVRTYVGELLLGIAPIGWVLRAWHEHEDAVAVVYHRSRLQATTRGYGAMLATALSEEDAAELLTRYDQVDIAAKNSQSMLTLAGADEQLQVIAEELTEKDIFNRYLKVEVAYHSPYMDPIEEGLRQSEILEVKKIFKCQRPYSTKRRIKTLRREMLVS